MQLKDVAVFITGGGSGLGAATAHAMAAKGAKVAVFDQHKENAEKVATEVKGVATVGDVTDEEQVKAAIANCPMFFVPTIRSMRYRDMVDSSPERMSIVTRRAYREKNSAP